MVFPSLQGVFQGRKGCAEFFRRIENEKLNNNHLSSSGGDVCGGHGAGSADGSDPGKKRSFRFMSNRTEKFICSRTLSRRKWPERPFPRKRRKELRYST